MDAEINFEKAALSMLAGKNWPQLALLAEGHMQKKNASHYRAYFYLGVADYKMFNYEDALYDFNAALGIMADRDVDVSKFTQINQRIDPQLFYNLGLVNFKLQQYAKSAEHFKNCIRQDP